MNITQIDELAKFLTECSKTPIIGYDDVIDVAELDPSISKSFEDKALELLKAGLFAELAADGWMLDHEAEYEQMAISCPSMIGERIRQDVLDQVLTPKVMSDISYRVHALQGQINHDLNRVA